jgi:hypothetical protein
MEDFEKYLREAQDQWGRETVAAIIKAIDTYPIRWRGILKRSIIYKLPPKADQLPELFMADYGKFVDEGIGLFGPRKTRIPKKSIAGIAFHIKPWADSKGLNNWAVATNIVKRGGIKPRPFFTTVIEARLPRFGELVTEQLRQYTEDKLNNISREQ